MSCTFYDAVFENLEYSLASSIPTDVVLTIDDTIDRYSSQLQLVNSDSFVLDNVTINHFFSF